MMMTSDYSRIIFENIRILNVRIAAMYRAGPQEPYKGRLAVLHSDLLHVKETLGKTEREFSNGHIVEETEVLLRKLYMLQADMGVRE